MTGFIDGTENPQFPDDRAERQLCYPDKQANLRMEVSFLLSVMSTT